MGKKIRYNDPREIKWRVVTVTTTRWQINSIWTVITSMESKISLKIMNAIFYKYSRRISTRVMSGYRVTARDERKSTML